MNTYKVALVQMQSSQNLHDNLTYAYAAAREAAKNKASLIIFPETMNQIGRSDDFKYGEPLNGPTITKMSLLAKELGVWIHCGSFKESTNTKKMYNSSVLVNDQGKIVATYRKLHLFDVDPDISSFQESSKFLGGNDIVCIDTPFGKMGLAICYDLRFPELFRLLALKGAELIVMPASFVYQTGKAHWMPLIRARAIENSCYFLAANQTGQTPIMRAYGHSMVVDPWGKVIAQADDSPCILYAEIDRDLSHSTKKKIPSILNRRKDVYALSEID